MRLMLAYTIAALFGVASIDCTSAELIGSTRPRDVPSSSSNVAHQQQHGARYLQGSHPTRPPITPIPTFSPTVSPSESPIKLPTVSPIGSPSASPTGQVDLPVPTSPPITPRMEIDIVGSVIDYSSFDWSALIFGETNGIPEFFNARDIMLNVANNGVNTEINRGFGSLSTELWELQSSMGTLEPVQVTDIACPEGLMYAPKEVYCLNFKLLVNPADAADAEMINSFYDRLKSAIDSEGRLYDIVKEANPCTVVTGLGIPGKGIDYTIPTSSETVSLICSPSASPTDQVDLPVPTSPPIVTKPPVGGLPTLATVPAITDEPTSLQPV